MDSEETLRQENEVLKAIAELSAKFEKRINDLETKFDASQKLNDAQLESIRRGILDNAIRFDRLEGEIYLLRSEVSHIKADIKELTRKELV